MIPDRLDGTRIAITGGTGFLGTALIERLLRCVPGCQLVLLIRPGRRSTVEQRAKREIFSNNAFDRLREELGKDGFAAMVAERVTPIAGNVGTDGLALDDDGRDALAACTVLIHSAATVSFDSPLDAAVEVNLLGPTRIVQTLHALGVTPHLVSVSTCYVAGNRRGAAPEIPVHESPFFIDVDWRGEVDGARRARTDAEADSRRPDALARFRKEARHEIGAAGVPALAGKTEQRRSAWVKEQMVEAGRARAASLGWPDAYAYTKALGERALLQNRGDVPVSIVRPSIIESSLHEPFPGWIRGFRMAEPVIISYARGLLKEFPGVPEGTIDVIPVDLVVAAIIDAAAGPVPDEPTITQVASGSVNPLRYRHLVDMVSTFFTDHPIYDVEGQPILVPDWSFPGRGRVQRQLERAKGAIDRGERALQALPLRGKQAAWAAALESKREEVERALAYVELYGAYAECEAIYGVDRLLARWEQLGARGPGHVLLRPPRHRLGPLRPQGPPAVGGRARPGAYDAGRTGRREARRPAAPPDPGPRPPLRRLRPREHADRVERGRVVLVVGDPPAPVRGPDPVRAEDPPRGAGPPRPRQARPQRLPAPLLPPVRRRRRRPARGRRRWRCSASSS